MTEITATIARQYSDPRAEAVPWPQALSRLAAAEVSWIVTVRPDGRPHATPVVTVLDGETAYFCTGSTEVKRANLRTNPHVLVLAGDTEWHRGLDVTIEGVASRVTDSNTLRRFDQLYRERWDGRWDFDTPGEGTIDEEPEPDVVVFSVAPTKAFGHSKGDPFSQTNYRFTPDT